MAALPDIDVERVVRAAQAGDRLALDELLRHMRPRVFRWALVKMRDVDEAEDVAQEVALTLMRRLSRFTGGSFAAWLYRVTTNSAHDARRRSLRRPFLRIADGGEASEAAAPAALDSLDSIVSKETVATLRRFLNALPERQREILDLVDVQGFPAVEAAAMLGIEAPTARVHLLRARRALRARLLEREMDHDL